MAQEQDIVVISSGAVTSVGLSAASTCAAVRASLDGFMETHFIDEVGEPILGAMMPTGALPGEPSEEEVIVGGAPRLAAMFTQAAREALNGAGFPVAGWSGVLVQGLEVEQVPLILIEPEAERAGRVPGLLSVCGSAFLGETGRHFHGSSRAITLGSPGLAAAFRDARAMLSDPRNERMQAVLIAGVDSLLNVPDVLDGLEKGRLLTSQNSDGFIPGEGAACLLVMRAGHARAWHRYRRAVVTSGPPSPARWAALETEAAALKVSGVGIETEEETLELDRPARGRALARAIKGALREAGLEAHQVGARWSDATAEGYFFEEASYAWSRNLRSPSPPEYRFQTPVTRVGHVGTAMGPLMGALILDGIRKGWGAAGSSLIHLSSAGAPRGAVVIQRVQLG